MSNRRQRKREELGLHTRESLSDHADSLRREEARIERKLAQKAEIEKSRTYRVMGRVSVWMDKYFLDAVIGLIPVVGDLVSLLSIVPFSYISLIKIKSVPLTLAIIFNTLADILIGLIPYHIGDILDILHRSYLKNYRLIVGFVEDDRKTIDKVNRNASLLVAGIVVMTILNVLMIVLVVYVLKATTSFLWNLFF